LWGSAILLAIIGVGAAIGRGVFLADFATRVDPVREQILDALRLADPFLMERAEGLDQFDGRFAAHPVLTLLHVLPGGIFLVLAPFQFSSRIRSRHIRFHRWSGRALILAGLLAASTGLYFGILMPYGGLAESAIIVLVAGLFLTAVARAFVAIRKHQVARHREWMIRAFAVAIGVSTVRIVAGLYDMALAPAGVRPAEIFVLSLWTGWVLTLGAAELWIRYTRPHGRRSYNVVPTERRSL
jgi:uncharacterized membrane protein